jgi:death-on-curing protein
METMLLLNGYELVAPMDEQESVMLRLAGGGVSRSELSQWVRTRMKPIGDGA